MRDKCVRAELEKKGEGNEQMGGNMSENERWKGVAGAGRHRERERGRQRG